MIPASGIVGRYNLNASTVIPALTLPIESAEETLVLINPPVSSLTSFYPAIRYVNGQVLPKRSYSLVSGINPIKMERVSEDSIRLSSDKALFVSEDELFTRPIDAPLKKGDIFEYSGISVEILALSEATLPSEILVRFSKEVIRDVGRWVICKDDAWQDIDLPEVGASIDLDACGLWFKG